MKISKMFLFGFLIVLTTVGCKKKGCMDVLAENYDTEAKKDDASCTYLSDKMLGSYTVSQDCYYGGVTSYTMEVVAGSNKGEIILQNLDDNVQVKATISGTEFTFSEDKAGITYEGNGYLVGSDGMTINLEICETYYYPCTDPELCTLTCTK
ncbi:MAG: hypothetical protein ACI8ZM_001061 [Crocinitomix sp.]|jgi:hypothetical protein